jgi:hypothetical protein
MISGLIFQVEIVVELLHNKDAGINWYQSY